MILKTMLILTSVILSIYGSIFLKINTVKEGKNDCMIQFIIDCKDTGICEGNIYKLDDTSYHIEHKSKHNVFLDKYKIGEFKNGKADTGNFIVDFSNNEYFRVANLITK